MINLAKSSIELRCEDYAMPMSQDATLDTRDSGAEGEAHQ